MIRQAWDSGFIFWTAALVVALIWAVHRISKF